MVSNTSNSKIATALIAAYIEDWMSPEMEK